MLADIGYGKLRFDILKKNNRDFNYHAPELLKPGYSDEQTNFGDYSKCDVFCLGLAALELGGVSIDKLNSLMNEVKGAEDKRVN